MKPTGKITPISLCFAIDRNGDRYRSAQDAAGNRFVLIYPAPRPDEESIPSLVIDEALPARPEQEE